ncbi:MAG: hypothetical protein R6U89_12585 [Dehalococcoidia bacterium]
MKAFTTHYGGIRNVLNTKAGIGKPIETILSSIPEPLNEYQAIWDTGATNCVITQKVVRDCDLKPTGMQRVYTPSGEDWQETFLISLYLPNKVVFPSVRVTQGKLSGDSEILIGMDIINQGDFAVSNYGGRTLLTFRIPSIGVGDFVKDIQKGRNSGLTVTGQTGPNRATRRKKKKSR